MDYILFLMNICAKFKPYAVLLSVTIVFTASVALDGSLWFKIDYVFTPQEAFAVTYRGEDASSQLHVSHPLYLEHRQ